MKKNQPFDTQIELNNSIIDDIGNTPLKYENLKYNNFESFSKLDFMWNYMVENKILKIQNINKYYSFDNANQQEDYLLEVDEPYWNKEYLKEAFLDYYRDVLYSVNENLRLLKYIINAKTEYQNQTELTTTIKNKLNEYHEVFNNTKGLNYKNEYILNCTYKIFENKIDLIVKWSLQNFDTYMYGCNYGLEPTEHPEICNEGYPFVFVDTPSWTKLEFSSQAIIILNTILKNDLSSFQKNPIDQDVSQKKYEPNNYTNSIFKSLTAEKIFKDTLYEFNCFDKTGSLKKRGVQPIFDAFFQTQIKNHDIFKRNVMLKEFIEFLNGEYAANIGYTSNLSSGIKKHNDIRQFVQTKLDQLK